MYRAALVLSAVVLIFAVLHLATHHPASDAQHQQVTATSSTRVEDAPTKTERSETDPAWVDASWRLWPSLTDF